MWGSAEMNEFDWSEWYPLSQQFLANVPDTPGIYEIRTDYQFGRLNDLSQLVYVGSAARGVKPSLRRRLGARVDDPEGNLSPAEKMLVGAGHVLEFRFTKAENGETARQMEIQKLSDYVREHWEAPPGVSKKLG